jgi:hypothetical protein
VVDRFCPTCQQQGRQLKLARLQFNMARLNFQAPGLFDQPAVETCLVCDGRIRNLFDRLGPPPPAVRPCFSNMILCTELKPLPCTHVEGLQHISFVFFRKYCDTGRTSSHNLNRVFCLLCNSRDHCSPSESLHHSCLIYLLEEILNVCHTTSVKRAQQGKPLNSVVSPEKKCA